MKLNPHKIDFLVLYKIYFKMSFLKSIYKRPDYDANKDYLWILTNAPIFIMVLAFIMNRKGWVYHPVFLWTIVLEEFLLRYLPFLYMKKTVINSVFTAILFSVCYTLTNFSELKEYFLFYCLMGFIYALSSRKYSSLEIIIFRLVFIMLIFD